MQKSVELLHAGQMEQHLAMISDRVRQNWLRPEGSANIDCDVRITQTRNGEMFSLAVVCCEGSDAVVRSIEAAVEQAAPCRYNQTCIVPESPAIPAHAGPPRRRHRGQVL